VRIDVPDDAATPAERPEFPATHRLRVALLAGVVLTVLLGGTVLASTRPAEPERPWPGWGFTHTQVSADHGDETAVSSVVRALQVQSVAQNQHIMGFGAENPEPDPGTYHFDSLDRRMDLIRRSGGVPVITLCCAPDWMKGGDPGTTDWDTIEDAPLPEHYADFADLSAVIARRYPDVRHFIVWNELKGFFDDENDRWDAAAYTAMYNEVYAAVKAARPDALVGGPYMGMATVEVRSPYASSVRGEWGAIDWRALDVVEYWLAHRAGADFVVVDGHATTEYGAPDEFAALEKFSAVNGWLRTKTPLPLWWAEWYVDRGDSDWTTEHRIALRTAALIELARSGADTAFYWNPQPDDGGCDVCLWTGTGSADGGRPLPFLHVLQQFAQSFPPGTPLEEVAGPPEIRILAQKDALLVVNTVSRSTRWEVDGHTIELDPYETRWIARPT
jgi:hypothetical protein